MVARKRASCLIAIACALGAAATASAQNSPQARAAEHHTAGVAHYRAQEYAEAAAGRTAAEARPGPDRQFDAGSRLDIAAGSDPRADAGPDDRRSAVRHQSRPGPAHYRDRDRCRRFRCAGGRRQVRARRQGDQRRHQRSRHGSVARRAARQAGRGRVRRNQVDRVHHRRRRGGRDRQRALRHRPLARQREPRERGAQRRR